MYDLDCKFRKAMAGAGELQAISFKVRERQHLRRTTSLDFRRVDVF